MEIRDILVELTKLGIHPSMHYDIDMNQCYLDLNTQAKSHLYLYEDGILRGRYQYQKEIDFNDDIEHMITILCNVFKRSLCGRDYGNPTWAELCDSKGIKYN